MAQGKKCHSETSVTADGQHFYGVQWWTDDLSSHPSGFSEGDWLRRDQRAKGSTFYKLGHRTQSKPTWYNNIKVSSVCPHSISCYTAKFSIIIRIAWLHYFQAIGRHKVPLSFGTFFMYVTIFYDFAIFLPCECGIRKASGDTSDSQFLDWLVYPYWRRGAGGYRHVLWSWKEIAYTFTFQNYLIMSPLNLLTFSF